MVAEGPRLALVGCNPSLITWQAGARLDPTSANCEAIARRDGYAGVTMLNLWELRGTDPRELRDHPDPIGPGWAEEFDEAVRDMGFVVGAWGTASYCAGTRVARRRIAEVVDRLVALGLEVRCLSQTADGEPRHLSLRGVSRGALPALQPFVGRTRTPWSFRPERPLPLGVVATAGLAGTDSVMPAVTRRRVALLIARPFRSTERLHAPSVAG